MKIHVPLALIAMMVAACSRNSLELPPPTLRNAFDTVIGTGSEPRIKLRFLKTGLGGNDTIKVSLQNDSQDDLTNLKLLLELTNGQQGNQLQVLRHMVLSADKLKPGTTTDPYIVALDSTLQLRGNGRLVCGILSGSTSSQYYANDYNSEMNTIAFEKRGIVQYRAKVYGFILGNSTVIFRSPDATNEGYKWLFTGSLADTSYFSGNVTTYNSYQSTAIFLDTLVSGIRFDDNADKKTLTFRLRLADTLTTDSIDHILFTLHKN